MVDQINHHLYRKRGFYYFSRRVPKALLGDYSKPRIVLALKTRHFRDALRQSQILSKRLDDQWFQMQLDALGLVLDSDPRRVTKTGSAQSSDAATDPAAEEPDTDDPAADADNDPAQADQQD